MANTIKFGNGQWATKKDSILAYNDENANFKHLPFVTSRASTATRVNKLGLIETVASGIPRVDYLGNTKGALLLEPQRTNLFPYSEDFENSAWDKNAGATITNNYAISPDGTQNAARYLGTGTSGIADKFTLSVTEHTISFWVKSNNGVNQFCQLLGDSNQGSGNLLVTTEWTRLSHTFTASGLANKSNGIFRDSSNNNIDILIWGAQLEQSSYASSLIPTNGSTVTRLAESADNAGNNQVISSSEGVLYFEGSVSDTLTNSWISLYEKSNITNNQFNLRFVNSTNLIQCVSRAGALGQDVVLQSTITDKTVVNKIAVKYKLNDWALWVNGVEVDTATSSTAFTPNSLDVLSLNKGNNSQFFYGKTNDLRVYNTALTDAELAALTQV